MHKLQNTHSLRLHVGEVVEVRSKAEILATLDENGRLDGLPFMPEMLKYCGQRFRVYKSAHKTCDTIEKTGARRIENAVHLEGLRCDGEAHGGCQASCLIFWKEAWLKRVHLDKELSIDGSALFIEKNSAENGIVGCTEAALMGAARKEGVPGGSDHEAFVCQTTELTRATSPLVWWDISHYIRDITSGNVRLFEFTRVILIAIFNTIQRCRGGRGYPSVPQGTLTKTPTATLDLQPGEVVQVKTKDEIASTLNTNQRNRGLWFDVEMVRYCEGKFKVLKRVEKIIDERTGKMMQLPNDCIILEGVACRAEFSGKRLFCPRSIYPYWREIWLERTSAPGEGSH